MKVMKPNRVLKNAGLHYFNDVTCNSIGRMVLRKNVVTLKEQFRVNCVAHMSTED